jgi:hypothetical protein
LATEIRHFDNEHPVLASLEGDKTPGRLIVQILS